MMYVEDEYSKKLFELNQQYLISTRTLNEQRKNKLSVSNFRILFSYLRSLSFSRIFRRMKLKSNKGKQFNNEYKLKESYNLASQKLVVYTCFFGGYDDLKEPLFVNPLIEYRVFTDQHIPSNSVWKKQDIPQEIDLSNLTPVEKNRYFKMLPHKLFPDFDYSIYIDGNIRIIADLLPLCDLNSATIALHKYQVDCIYNMKSAIIAGKRAKRKAVNSQIKRYKKKGFPKHFGAFECNVIVRKHNDNGCIKIMESWWKEFSDTTSKRDQLSFPFVLWKNGKTADFIHSLGNDVSLNPRFQISHHIKR